MNVLICLKSRLIGEALCELLEKDGSGDRIFVANTEGSAHCSKADVIVIDQGSLHEEFLSHWPEAKIILLDTGLTQEEVTTLVLMYRLHGVLSTDEDAALAKKALRLVHEGQIWINNSNLKALLYKAGTISLHGGAENVSKREKQILEQIVKGSKNKEIAAQLFMSEQTVKAHLSHLFKKFKVSSRSQLISLLLKSSRETQFTEHHASVF
jgi:DNA-binding NarL/FixJ family response regulator